MLGLSPMFHLVMSQEIEPIVPEEPIVLEEPIVPEKPTEPKYLKNL